MSLPDQAEIVIVGGGIVGVSIAYHLAKLGRRDVVLLEQGRLSGGTTWHAAGLVGQLRSHANLTRLIRYSAELYAGLGAETGLATGWKRCGSVSVARTPERMVALKRTAAAARGQGVECHLISPEEAGKLWPAMRTDDLVGAVWLPGDGKANPSDITQALARGARTGGTRIIEQTRVTGLVKNGRRVTAVETDKGKISCETLVIAAGQWSRALGKMAGVTIPLHSAEHMYIVTEKMAGVTPDLPVMRDPDGYIYFKEEVGGLVMGGFEPKAKPWGMDGIPHPFEFQLLPDDWDQFEILMENALIRVPALADTPVKTFVNGPESFTPDANYILGEAPETDGVFVAAGFNSMGIASAGGAGKALAEWIVDGRPSVDLWPVDIRRFAGFQGNGAWLKDRITEVLGLHYAMPWPNRELETARPLRRSALYDRLLAKGAVFGSKMGWERPLVFVADAARRDAGHGYGAPHWLPECLAEQRAAREKAALFDLTSFGKLMVKGRDAEAVLQMLCANDIAVPVGTSVYTALLNERGGFESDVTVSRLDDTSFLLVTGTSQVTRDLDWIERRIPEVARCAVVDVTSAYGVLALSGPLSREILAKVSGDALDDGAFPHGAVRNIGVGHATGMAVRRSYAGELGYEMFVATEMVAHVYDALMAAGAPFGLVDAGYAALEALRIEKGFRAWGRELTPDGDPYMAGLGFAVAPAKPDFIGRDAIAEKRAGPHMRRIASLVAEAADAPLAHGGELVLRDGVVVGEITSAAIAAVTGRLVALVELTRPDGVLDEAWLRAGAFTYEVAGVVAPCSVSLAAPYDPKGQRVRP